MSVSRRNFMSKLGVGALSAAGVLTATAGHPARADDCTMPARINGSGSYQLGPFDPIKEGDEPAYLITDLGFDETMLFCKVTTNFAGFRFPTAKMGMVEIGAHEFFMDMQSVSIDSVTIEETPDGPQVNFNGVLKSVTRLYKGVNVLEFAENNISFGCQSTALNPQAAASASTKNFSMNVRFNPMKEQAAIFGEQATFAGRLTRGNIIIVPASIIPANTSTPTPSPTP